MNVISDTNIFLAVALEEESKEWIIGVTGESSIISPEILPYEVGNALSAMIKRKQLTKAQAIKAQKIINQIPVRLVTANLHESLVLAIEHNIYAYDAYFLNCALTYSYPLITLDKRMKAVALDLGIDVLE